MEWPEDCPAARQAQLSMLGGAPKAAWIQMCTGGPNTWGAEYPVSKHTAQACRCKSHLLDSSASPRLCCPVLVCHAAELLSLKGHGSDCLKVAPHLLVVIYEQTLPHLSLLQALLGILQLLQTHKEMESACGTLRETGCAGQTCRGIHSHCCCAGRTLLLPAELLLEAYGARCCLKRPLTFLMVLS